MNVFLASAAAMCGVTTFLHCYFGGKGVAVPLLRAADIHDVPKYTNYYCWHMVSVVLAVMTLSFLWAAAVPAAVEAAIMAELLAITFMLWGMGLVVWKKQTTRDMPQWILFAAISAAGGAGLLL